MWLKNGFPVVQFSGQLCLEIGEGSIYGLKDIAPHIASSKAKDHPAGMCRHVTGQIDQVVDHSPEAAALNGLSDPRIAVAKCLLADHPEDVIGKNSQLKHKGVGLELP